VIHGICIPAEASAASPTDSGTHLWFYSSKDTLCASGFVDDVVFSDIGPAVACGGGSIYVSAVLEQVVINVQRIRQVAPHRLTLSSYTVAANFAPGAKSAVYDCLVVYVCAVVWRFVGGTDACSALTLLVWRQEEHPACKKIG